jgi:hypothetical protein
MEGIGGVKQLRGLSLSNIAIFSESLSISPLLHSVYDILS